MSLFGRMFTPGPLQWEYAVRTSADFRDLEAGLNKLGQEGWELVSVDPGLRAQGVVREQQFFFKRAKGMPPFAGRGGVGGQAGGALPFGGGVGATSASRTSGESRGGGRTERAAPAKEDVVVVPLRHASATALARTLQQVYSNSLTGRMAGLRVASDERTNALILAGTEEMITTVRALVEQLDVQ